MKNKANSTFTNDRTDEELADLYLASDSEGQQNLLRDSELTLRVARALYDRKEFNECKRITLRLAFKTEVKESIKSQCFTLAGLCHQRLIWVLLMTKKSIEAGADNEAVKKNYQSSYRHVVERFKAGIQAIAPWVFVLLLLTGVVITRFVYSSQPLLISIGGLALLVLLWQVATRYFEKVKEFKDRLSEAIANAIIQFQMKILLIWIKLKYPF